MKINKHDTNGTKPLLGKGELGYDDYSAGGDTGRVYVGNGASNIALAKKSEVDAKVVANAGITAGTATKVTYDAKGLVTSGSNPTTLGGYGITDAYTKTETNTQISTAVSGLVYAAPATLDTLNELAAALGDDPNFATTTANNIAAKVAKVVSTDNAVVRFNGVTGDVQNSGVIIDDNGNLNIKNGTNGQALFVATSAGNTTLSAFGDASQIIGGAKDTKTVVYSDSSVPICFNLGLTERMRIDSAGNVGIGVTPSAWAVGNAIQYTNGSSVSGVGNSTMTMHNAYYDGAFKYIGTGYYATQYEQNKFAGTHTWRTAPSGTAGSAITWTNAMTLDADGNLFLNADNAVSGKYAVIYGGATGSYLQLWGRNVADTQPVLTNYIGGVAKSAILSNGTYQSATNVYGSTSDIKLKENIVDTSPKLDKLMQVQVKNFNYIGQEEKQIGVIAQEIEQIFPSIVYETKDTEQVEVQKERVIPAVEEVLDDEGNVVQEAVAESIETYTETEIVETGEVTKNVKYSVIYMMMLKGMQEQNEIIKDLKARIEILENK